MFLLVKYNSSFTLQSNLLNIVYNVFNFFLNAPCILYKYLCANMLHVGDIYFIILLKFALISRIWEAY